MSGEGAVAVTEEAKTEQPTEAVQRFSEPLAENKSESTEPAKDEAPKKRQVKAKPVHAGKLALVAVPLAVVGAVFGWMVSPALVIVALVAAGLAGLGALLSRFFSSRHRPGVRRSASARPMRHGGGLRSVVSRPFRGRSTGGRGGPRASSGRRAAKPAGTKPSRAARVRGAISRATSRRTAEGSRRSRRAAGPSGSTSRRHSSTSTGGGRRGLLGRKSASGAPSSGGSSRRGRRGAGPTGGSNGTGNTGQRRGVFGRKSRPSQSSAAAPAGTPRRSRRAAAKTASETGAAKPTRRAARLAAKGKPKGLLERGLRITVVPDRDGGKTTSKDAGGKTAQPTEVSKGEQAKKEGSAATKPAASKSARWEGLPHVPQPKPAAELDDPKLAALADRIRQAAQAPIPQQKGTQNVYAHMIDESTPERKSATAHDAAETARRDGARLDEQADEFFSQAAALDGKPGMEGTAAEFRARGRELREDADQRRGMARAYDEAAGRFAAERSSA